MKLGKCLAFIKKGAFEWSVVDVMSRPATIDVQSVRRLSERLSLTDRLGRVTLGNEDLLVDLRIGRAIRSD